MARYDDYTQRAEPDPHPPIRPRKRRRLWPWIVLAAVAALFFIALAGADDTTPQQTSGDPSFTLESGQPIQPTDPQGPPPPVIDGDAAAVLAYGQTYTDGDGLRLTAAAPKAGDATLGATYCAQVTYENGTTEPVAFGIFDWKMVDTEGVEGTATFAGGDTVDSGLGQGNLRPQGKKTGQVCWDKQGAGTPVEIIYQGSLLGDQVVWRK